MTLRNTEFRITFRSRTGRFYYSFAKDASGWYQVTAAGNRHKATAEQVLNHVLPALAEIEPGARLKPGVQIAVEYVPEPVSPDKSERPAAPAHAD
jgi:hypothetical protein